MNPPARTGSRPAPPRRALFCPAVFASLLVLVLVIVIGPLLATAPLPGPSHAAAGEDGPGGAREETYPPQVRNVTHEPVAPRLGQDIQVVLTLHEDHDGPRFAGLTWCRVEPDYVCTAFPRSMRETAPGVWTATIPGSLDDETNVIQQDTRHIGYTIRIDYETDGPHPLRVHVPTHNTWTPPGFPTEVGGDYYFIALGEPARGVPGPPLLALPALVLVAVHVLVGFTALPLRRAQEAPPRGGDRSA